MASSVQGSHIEAESFHGTFLISLPIALDVKGLLEIILSAMYNHYLPTQEDTSLLREVLVENGTRPIGMIGSRGNKPRPSDSFNVIAFAGFGD